MLTTQLKHPWKQPLQIQGWLLRQSQTLTSDPQGADGVLIDCEALFQGMRSHILIKDVTSSEVENTTVVLIFGDQP